MVDQLKINGDFHQYYYNTTYSCSTMTSSKWGHGIFQIITAPGYGMQREPYEKGCKVMDSIYFCGYN